MNLKRFANEYVSQGSILQVREMSDEGYAELDLHFPKDGLLFQYNPNIQYIFSNRKRADGILFFPEDDKSWGMLLVELKKTVNSGKQWEDIKLQWHGAWLHAMAIAAVLGIKLSGRVDVMVAYRKHHMGANLPDPILLKQNIDSAFKTQTDWNDGLVDLSEVGKVRLHRQPLDATTGTAAYVFA